MDLMKVFDQTVREIRREVNLKVLKVPEIEQKVLDATSNEPWGPHGSALSEIARATNKFSECPMVMNVLWTRLTDTGANWRHVYKALAVIEYLIANGSERALDDILEHSFQITSISGFEYVEPNGKDVGNNVRKKVEAILALLDDTEKIKAVRDKAAANRDKYVGLSSTGISYKSKLNSYGSNDYHHSDRYGGIGGQREGDSFKDSYENTEGYHQENKDDQVRSRDSIASKDEENKLKKGVGSNAKDQYLPAKPMAKPGYPSDKRSSTQPNNIEDDFDDFDPRGSATTGSVEANSSPVDVLGQGLLIDLMDTPASLPAEATLNNTTAAENDLFADDATAAENDLFADAVFVSASSHVDAVGDSHYQGNIEFFTNQPAFPSKYTSNVDLFAGPDPSLPPKPKSSKLEPPNSNNIDPFAAVPLTNFEGLDFSGAFTSHTDPVVTEPSKKSIDSNLKNVDQSSVATKAPSKKDTFQVKSGIWADSLSRGLIDLNISAPKKISLADVGVVGGLGDGSDEKRPASSTYMGSTVGPRSVWGTSGFPTTVMSNGSFTASGEQQFGSFN